MSYDSPASRTWEAALGRLQLQVTRPSYDTWLRGTHALSLEATSLVVGVPGKVVRRLTRSEIRGIDAGMRAYLGYAERHRKSSRVVFPGLS